MVGNLQDSTLYECEFAFLARGQLPGQDAYHFQGDDPPPVSLSTRLDSHRPEDGNRPLRADSAVVLLRIGMLRYFSLPPYQMAPLRGEMRESLV
jgi:hypothetical protein